MGQGTEIGWIKMIAEELDLPTDRVSVVLGHTDQTINMGGASGSTGIWKAGTALRAASAEARRVLIEMASEKLGVPADRLTVADGVISDKTDAAKKISYGELIGGRYFDVELDWNHEIGNDLVIKGKAKPKPPSEYKIVGKPGTRRRDVAPKVLGTLEYMVDVKVPGMLHGRMIRPPVAGAIPAAVDDDSVNDIPGVQVVWQKGFIGVVAPREWDAIRASRQLKVTWTNVNPPFTGNAGLYDHIRNAEVVKYDPEVKTRRHGCGLHRVPPSGGSELRMAVPVACRHGAGLRGRRRARRRGDGLVGDAEAALLPRRHRQDASLPLEKVKVVCHHRARLIRPQRCGRRRHGRGGAVEGGRQTGARAGHAL